jgi:hypothetical protein
VQMASDDKLGNGGARTCGTTVQRFTNTIVAPSDGVSVLTRLASIRRASLIRMLSGRHEVLIIYSRFASQMSTFVHNKDAVGAT